MQGEKAPFGDVAATDFHLVRLIGRGINICKSHQCLLVMKLAHITDPAMRWTMVLTIAVSCEVTESSPFGQLFTKCS